MGILWLVKQQQQQQWLLRWLPRHLLLPSFGRHATSLRPFYNATIREGQRPQKSPPPPPQTPEAVHFIVDYLVSACGLSRTDAMKASKYLAHLKSPAKPDAVLRLLKETGLGESDIRRLVRLSPAILVADPKKTLEPKIKALRGAGFSGPEVAQLVSVNPHTLRLRNAVSKIEFWRKMVGDNKKLLKIVGNTHVLSCNLDCKCHTTFGGSSGGGGSRRWRGSTTTTVAGEDGVGNGGGFGGSGRDTIWRWRRERN